MCGIVGLWAPNSTVSEESIKFLTQKLNHRGPDSQGTWIGDSGKLAFGHARLSILDLSPAGHQPMHSSCGRYTMVFNGEIYNHLELRRKLDGPWIGSSDTETLLRAIQTWGVKKTLESSVGMFAIALYDSTEQQLILARDRFGEKPLYYGWQGDTFYFASELKSISAHPKFIKRESREALTLLLRHNYIPAPFSIYEDIFKLEQGTYLVFNREGRKVQESYWSFEQQLERAQKNPFTGSFAEASSILEEKLKATIKQQMLSDVPLGAFLSGGVDSSAIVALMQAQSDRPVKTFTIGFHEKQFNEAEFAKSVALHLKTDHTEVYIDPNQALDFIPRLHEIYCEPFADSSQLPTLLVSKIARQHVTVSLSGDAGDEVFGGYNRYFIASRLWEKTRRLPLSLRKGLAGSITSLSPDRWNRLIKLLDPLLPPSLQFRSPGEKAYKVATILKSRNEKEVYRHLVSLWLEPDKIVKGVREPETFMTRGFKTELDSFEHWMMAMDTMTYMPDDILVKVDRAAMASSLETRVPFLDHSIVEFAWSLPLDFKIHQGRGKRILRDVLYRHIPRELIERPKTGFGVPLGAWLRGPLKEWAHDLLSEQKLKDGDFFEVVPIQKMWQEHLENKNDWNYHLWCVLMFQAWRQ
jgi:asparagine synthase (glutamine-hydrolysing)